MAHRQFESIWVLGKNNFDSCAGNFTHIDRTEPRTSMFSQIEIVPGALKHWHHSNIGV